MKKGESQVGRSLSSTELGRMLRAERASVGMRRAKDMADAMGISSGHLSAIENGKNKSMDIEFLIRCNCYFKRKYFEHGTETPWDEKKAMELFGKGLMSASKNILLSMSYFPGKKRDLLVKLILTLLLIPNEPPMGMTVLLENERTVGWENPMSKASGLITSFYDAMKKLDIANEGLIDLPLPPPRRKITRKRRKNKPSGNKA